MRPTRFAAATPEKHAAHSSSRDQKGRADLTQSGDPLWGGGGEKARFHAIDTASPTPPHTQGEKS